jgi:hypothetical protein
MIASLQIPELDDSLLTAVQSKSGASVFTLYEFFDSCGVVNEDSSLLQCCAASTGKIFTHLGEALCIDVHIVPLNNESGGTMLL